MSHIIRKHTALRSLAVIAGCAGLFLAAALPALPAKAPTVARVRIQGREYVPLEPWARASGFTVRRSGTRDLILTRGKQRLRFTVDSRAAEINGVTVWLSLPVAPSRGSMHLGWLDFETVIQPILAPGGNGSRRVIDTVCLDPGHGGHDPGNQAQKQAEKKHTLLLARELKKELTRAGLRVVLTRNTDRYVDHEARPDYARRHGADLFVSLHYNSSYKGNTARGVEVFCLTPAGADSTNARGSEASDRQRLAANRFDAENTLLAYHIQNELLRGLNVEDRGLRRARFAVLRAATMPAVLVEGGFMSHREEAARIFDEQYRRRMARALAAGILAYKRTLDPVLIADKQPAPAKKPVLATAGVAEKAGAGTGSPKTPAARP